MRNLLIKYLAHGLFINLSTPPSLFFWHSFAPMNIYILIYVALLNPSIPFKSQKDTLCEFGRYISFRYLAISECYNCYNCKTNKIFVLFFSLVPLIMSFTFDLIKIFVCCDSEHFVLTIFERLLFGNSFFMLAIMCS